MGISLILIIIISSTWVYKDSEIYQISITEKPYSENTGQMAWLFSCLFLWPFFFTYYMIKRSKVLKIRFDTMVDKIKELENRLNS
ncbi:hypothetical protein KAU33_13170 [Candidatus Dependentiae bacterium]|nr:hypothetical protein [Candidatus Dependentiae bacterium]